MNFKEATAFDYSIIEDLAKVIWNECYQTILSAEQRNYMIDKFLSSKAIEQSIKEGYIFKLVELDQKNVGFFSYKIEDDNNIFLSKLYLLNEVRGKKITSNVIDYLLSMRNEIYLTVNKYNTKAFEVYKHKGFIVSKSIVTDIGNGYIMDDYVMTLKG